MAHVLVYSLGKISSAESVFLRKRKCVSWNRHWLMNKYFGSLCMFLGIPMRAIQLPKYFKVFLKKKKEVYLSRMSVFPFSSSFYGLAICYFPLRGQMWECGAETHRDHNITIILQVTLINCKSRWIIGIFDWDPKSQRVHRDGAERSSYTLILENLPKSLDFVFSPTGSQSVLLVLLM